MGFAARFFSAQIAASLLSETVLFLVERKSGALLASSITGQSLVGSFDSVTGSAQVLLADHATSAVLSNIASATIDPVTGWTRFTGTHYEDIQTGDYYAHVGPVSMEV